MRIGGKAVQEAEERRSWPDRLAFAGLAAILIAVPWPWGSNVPLARALLGTAAAGLLLFWLLSYAAGWLHGRRLGLTARVSIVLWLAWLLWIGLSLLPLPPGLLQELSPLAWEQHQRVLGLGLTPLYTLSIAPGRTFDALLDSFTLFCLYCLALVLVSTRGRVRLLLSLVFLTGVLQALYGIHMTVSGMEWGFFEPKKVGRGWATGTFINRNHFAAYLTLAGAAGVGLVLMDLGRWSLGSLRDALGGFMDLMLSAKFRTRIMLVVIVIAVVLSRSRMGNVALFGALAVAGLVFVLLRMRRALIPALLLFGSLAVVDLWVVSRYFGLDEVIERIEETDLESEQRPMVWQDLVPAVRDYSRTGAGLGSFAQAYSPYRSIEVRGYFDHAHNEYAEFAIETGLPGLGILASLVVIHMLHALRVLIWRRRSIYAGAAFAAVMSSAAMLLFGATEFMLHIPAVAVTWVVLLAVCAGIHSKGRSRKRVQDKGHDREPVNAVTETA